MSAPGERARAYRRGAYDLRETSRALAQRLTTRTCGLWSSYGRRDSELAGTVDFAIGPNKAGHKKAKLVGSHACGSVWECPVCHGRICASRAQDVTQFATEARARGYTLRMITLTIRHAWDDDLVVTRKAVANAWRAVLQDRDVRKLRAAETWHAVRAMEVKHGLNGWHPHLHVLVAISTPGDVEVREKLQTEAWDNGESDIEDADWSADEVRRRVIERAWIPACAKLAEESNRPLEGVAVVQTVITPESSDYLVKLGLEIADDRMKKAARDEEGSAPLVVAPLFEHRRMPFEILADARAGDVQSADLWRWFAYAMVGSRQLTWGHGVRKAFGLAVEPTEEDLAIERADVETDRVVLSIDTETYRRAIGSRPGLLAAVLDALELYGIGEALATISAYHGNDEAVQAIIESHRWISNARARHRERQTGDPDHPRERELRFGGRRA